jgi:hypothetical protein
MGARGAARRDPGQARSGSPGKDGTMLEFWTVGMIEAYQQARLDDVRRQYYVRPVGPGLYRRRRLYQQVLLRLGGVLVRAGQGLQARYAQTMSAGCEACQPAVGKGKA